MLDSIEQWILDCEQSLEAQLFDYEGQKGLIDDIIFCDQKDLKLPLIMTVAF